MSIERPGDEAVFAATLRDELDRAGRSGRARSELARAVGPDGGAERLAEALAALVAAGEAVEWNRRWMLLTHTPWRLGRVQAVSGGDAIVWPLVAGAAPQPGYFVKRRDLKRARDGDRVLIAPRRRRKRGPAHHLPEAAIVKVLERRSRLVGRVDGEVGYYRLAPFDRRVRLEVELPASARSLAGRYVVAELEPSPGALSSRARGRVVEDLGRLSEPGVDVMIALRHFEIPEQHPPAVMAAAAERPDEPTSEDLAGREDLRRRVTVTIDGETARDFDDAVSVEDLPGGAFRLGVHIADVSHYVPEGSVLDLEAYRRGTSVYFPERAVPMLPEALSNGLCSLRPGVDRLTMSVFLDVAADGEVTGRRFAESVIRSDLRLTYDEVRRLLESPAATDEADYGREVLALLGRARRLMEALLAARQRRGSIDFDLPSGDVVLDTDGVTIGVKPGERTVAHRLIEECMIAANEAVAAELREAGVAALYRVHEHPSEERLLALAELLEPFGVELPTVDGPPPPGALRDAMEAVAGRAEESFVATLVLQAMQRARYHPSPLGHYALASGDYTHFTSPIRRYPDLLVHRQLRNHLRRRAVEVDVKTLLSQRLPAIATSTSATERRAERAERLVLDWKALRLLAGREGKTFSGRVTAVKEYGLFVRLVDEYVDGLVPIASLGDDFYEYEEQGHRLVGRAEGRVFRLADELRVVLTGVDVHRRLVDLEIEGMPPGERRRGAANRRRDAADRRRGAENRRRRPPPEARRPSDRRRGGAADRRRRR